MNLCNKSEEKLFKRAPGTGNGGNNKRQLSQKLIRKSFDQKQKNLLHGKKRRQVKLNGSIKIYTQVEAACTLTFSGRSVKAQQTRLMCPPKNKFTSKLTLTLTVSDHGGCVDSSTQLPVVVDCLPAVTCNQPFTFQLRGSIINYWQP